jgi:hypothetical protein
MYKIYYTNEFNEARSYDESTLKEALLTVEGLRRNTRNSFVTMVSQDINSVGRPGVDSIENGLLPDGSNYEWRKRR